MSTSEIAELEKGELMEERLRAYFMDLGYYVLRGTKYKYQDVEVTDIDLWIYHRSTPISRERINVDIKNKNKGAAAVERIIVAKGIMNILGFDRCIVATTDKRPDVIEFGKQHGVVVLNGNFLARLGKVRAERYTEEDITNLLRDEYAKITKNWFSNNERAKSRLLQNLDFATANYLIDEVGDILAQIHAVPSKQENFIRLLYLYLSYLCICVDFILKDYAYIELKDKQRNLDRGFRYGAVEDASIKSRLDLMAKENGKSVMAIKALMDALPVNILVEFLSKSESFKNVFKWAIEFESNAYNKSLSKPSMLNPELKGIIGLFCDYSKVDRKLILTL